MSKVRRCLHIPFISHPFSSVSAASQAITTYIRNHLARCEAQQDHPLLLRHVLSGTPSDDDLVAALHSRVGGATLQRQPPSPDLSLNIPSGRLTNFRRGTIVWYLSKASGVSCPFARAGILLSNYSSTPSSNPKPRIREKCGEKRKRLITRHSRCTERQSPSPAPSSSPVDSGYAESPSASSSSDDEEQEEDEQRERPPKVKLTLRLRASPPPTNPNDIIDLSNDPSSSEGEQDVHMSSSEVNSETFCLPPYPRRSITVPSYTPVSPPTRTSLRYVFPQPPMESSRASASPPPDSDHEEEGDFDFDFDFSSDEEESRAVSVSVKLEDIDEGELGRDVSVKEKNVRDMLDAWEDLDLDRARSYSCTESCALVAREHEKQHSHQVIAEELEMWEWEFENAWGGVEVEVKKEDNAESLLPSRDLSLSPMHALPSSPWSPSPCSSTDGSSPPLSYSTTAHASNNSPQFTWAHTHTRRPSLERKSSMLNWQDAELLGPDSVHIAELELEWAGRRRIASPAPVSVSENVTSPEDAEMADPEPLSEHKEQVEVVVVHTCVPCDPPVSATQVEGALPFFPSDIDIDKAHAGIPVYQTTLPHGQTTRVLLRRLDTDFVNLTPLLAVFSPTASPPFCHSAVLVEHPNTSVSGTWAPLSIARQLLKHTSSPDSALRESVEVFLSDELVMRFPSALREFWRVSKPGRMLGQFGVCFEGGVVNPATGGVSRSVFDRASTLTLSSSPPPTVSIRSSSPPAQSPLTSSSSSLSPSLSRPESHISRCSEPHSSTSTLSSQLPTSSSPLSQSCFLPSHGQGKSKDHQGDTWILCEEPEAEPEPVLPPFDIALAELASGLGPSLGVLNMNMNVATLSGDTESPLSPTEAEMFRVLCVCPDWEEEEGEEDISPDPLAMCDSTMTCTDVDADADADGDVNVDVEVVEEEQRSLKDGRLLRRSKRVADAAARTRRTRGPRHA